MEKEIYIIKNKINNKIYIGQAFNTSIRWSGHKSAAKSNRHKTIIDQAISDLGVENFWYEVIETTEDYDTRERYWIKYYNCKIPNGYNFLDGGDGALPGINSANALIRDAQSIEKIINALSFSDIRMVDIAKKYGVSLKVISAINRGNAYADKSYQYPLRCRAADKIQELDYEAIINDLEFTSISYRKLAEIYQTTDYIIRQINQGKKFFNITKNYPLRKKDDNKILKIKYLLKNTQLSMHEIGRQCDISYSMVAHINNGKYHYCETDNYPIRK